MKTIKIIAVLMISLMLVACNTKNNKNEDINNSKKNINLTIGVSPDYPPYESLDLNNNIIGFDADMVKLLPNYINDDTTTYTFEWVIMDFNNIVTQIQAGQIDLGISGFSYDEERAVEWSIPYTASAQAVVTKSNTNITSIADLKGKILAAQTTSTGEKAANEIEGVANVASLADVKMVFQGLFSNQYDAVVVDLAVAREYAKENADLVILEETLQDEDNYIIAKQGNLELINIINNGLEKFFVSSEYQELCNEYGLKAVSK